MQAVETLEGVATLGLAEPPREVMGTSRGEATEVAGSTRAGAPTELAAPALAMIAEKTLTSLS